MSIISSIIMTLPGSTPVVTATTPSAGSTWSPIWNPCTVVTDATTNSGWTNIVFIKEWDMFIALAWHANYVCYSHNGVDWHQATLPYNDAWHGIAYGNGQAIIVGATAHTVTSIDGINWTAGTDLPAYNYYSDIAYGGGVFVAISTNYYFYSTNGASWNACTLPAGSLAGWTIAYGNGVFISATGDQPTSQVNKVGYSTNGITWSSVTLPVTDNIRQVRFNKTHHYPNGVFLALGGLSAILSVDGLTWTNSALSTNNDWLGLAYGTTPTVASGLYITTGQAYGTGGGNAMNWSFDGVTWGTGNMASTGDWFGIAYGNPTAKPDGIFVVLPYTGTTANWTAISAT